MSMIDPFERPKLNPWESARRFRQSDPLASRRIGQEAVEQQGTQPDTLSGTFQPVVSDIESPASAAEQAFQTRLQEAEQVSSEATQNVAQLAEMRRQQRIREQAQQQQTAQPQQGFSTGGYEDYGQNPRVGGSLNKNRQQVLQEAGRYVGSPYQLGGRTVKGIDCSGLVMAVYNQAGYNISQHSATWQGRNIPGVRTAVNNLQPGDIVAWKDGSHIAIYAGNGMIVDAASSGGTRYRPMWGSPEQTYGIKLRFPGE